MLSGKIQKALWNFEDPRFIIKNVNLFFFFSKKGRKDHDQIVSNGRVKGRALKGVKGLSLSPLICEFITYP